MTTITRHVRFRIVSNSVRVTPPSITLPLGAYEGYVDYEHEPGDDPKMVLAMIFIDEQRIADLEISGVPQPVKFEVLRYIHSGDIRIVED